MAKLAFYTQTYNSAKFVHRCIESILNQTYKDFVYYIADDVSTDNTREILKEYAEKDSRIKLILPEENSMMVNYNKSLQIIYDSGCEYLATMDADDWYDEDFAETVMNYAKKNDVDLICVGTNFVDDVTNEVNFKRAFDFNVEADLSEFDEKYSWLRYFFITHWGKLFKIKFLRDNKIFMDESILHGADTIFVYDYLEHIKNMVVLGDTKHNYLIRNTSTSHHYKKERQIENIKLYNKQMEFLKLTNSCNNINEWMTKNYYLETTLDCLLMILNCEESKNIVIDKYIEYLNDEVIKETIEIINDDDVIYIELLEKLNTTIFMFISNCFVKDYRADEVFNILTITSKDIGDFWSVDSLEKWCNHPHALQMLMFNQTEKIDSIVQFYNNDDFIKEVCVYLYVKYDIGGPFDIETYNLLSNKQLKYIMSNNLVLNKHDDDILILKYKTLVFNIINNDLINACDYIFDVVNENQEIDLTEFEMLGSILKVISALIDEVDYFIFANQMEVLAAIQKRDKTVVDTAIKNLEQLGVENEIIENFKNLSIEICS